MRSIISSFWAFLLVFPLFAQDPVKWSFSTKDAGNGQADLILTGTIEDGWATYSQFLESEDGPLATLLTFKEGAHYKLIGKAAESGDITIAHDKVFDMKVGKFKHKAIFTQRIQVSDYGKPVEGYITYMACNDERCVAPKDVDFKFVLAPLAPGTKPDPKEPDADKTGAVSEPGKTSGQTAAETETTGAETEQPASQTDEAVNIAPKPAQPDDPDFKGFFDSKRVEINAARFVNACESDLAAFSTSSFGVFFGGFLGGLLALLTPCVFPMIPMTVSFFVKRSRDRKTGLRNAFFYAASIVLIYVVLGAAVTAAFGPTVLNEMSTNKWFNLAFFAIFVVFALSFFGLFEITLPSSWVNKSDQMADKGGLIGIFFMAFTLALVSFSCTGPIVGTLLVEAARSNAGEALFGILPFKPLIGMFGFGLALALPFGLFALFPGWLHSLPKSGGWMDNVKITLGIVELALALKFFSTADMVEHWGLLKFETFLALWIGLALFLGLYQFGLLPLKGAQGRPGIGRATVGLASVAFAAYMGWGLLNYQSLSLLSGLAPPVHYSYRYDGQHKDGIGCPHGLDCYHDFDEGLAAAQKAGKPLFVDFTGHGCVNCRKMEENVWDKPGVIEHLRDNYVVVSLYVDDKKRLFPGNKFSYLLDPNTGNKMRTVGDKWSQFQVNNFATSSQPYYILMHNDGKTLLNKPRAFTPDVREYKSFLDCGLNAFQQVKNANRELIGGTQK
jgi:cytochrome c biogenesis protein CcdA/thioredoxin-related protein